MNRILAVVGIILLIALQVAAWPELTTRVLPAFCLAGAIAWGNVAGRVAGLRVAVILGVILDLYAQHNFGMMTVAMALGSGLPGLFVRDQDAGLATQLFALAVGALVYELLVLLWISMSDTQAAFFANLLGVATLNVLGTVVVGAGLTVLLAAVTSRQRYTSTHGQTRPIRF